MLGLALAPTVSHALAASGPGNPWAAICSVADGKVVVAESAGALVVDGADFLPALYAQSPSPLFAWAASQPRAPPASC